jgi:hypothetical protein
MLADALGRDDGPSALRWPSAAAPTAPDDRAGCGLHARRLRTGHDVCLLAVGRMVDTARRAADRLGEAGIAASVWDVRVVTPLDADMLDDAARPRRRRCGRDRHGAVAPGWPGRGATGRWRLRHPGASASRRTKFALTSTRTRATTSTEPEGEPCAGREP